MFAATDADVSSDDGERESSEVPGPGPDRGPPKRRSMLRPPKSYARAKPVAPPIDEPIVETTDSTSPQTSQRSPSPEPESLDATRDISPIPDIEKVKVGDRVKISGVKTGVIRFYGRTHFAEGEWCGIELDDPEGRHDGLVEGVRYFQCQADRGIFAPAHKVEPFTEDLYMYDSEAVYALSDISSCDERSPSPEKSPSIRREKSPSPEKGSRLPHPTGRSKPYGKSTSAHEKKTKISKCCEPAVDGTFIKDDRDDYSDDLPEISTPTRVDAHTAHTLTYGMESSGSDSETKQTNTTFRNDKNSIGNDRNTLTSEVDKNATFNCNQTINIGDNKNSTFDCNTTPNIGNNRNATFNCNTSDTLANIQNATFIKESNDMNVTFKKEGSPSGIPRLGGSPSGIPRIGESPQPSSVPKAHPGIVPDIVSQAGFMRQSSLEWDPEEDTDVMCMSTCSLGILTETQLMDNSLLGDEFREMLLRKEKEHGLIVAKQKRDVMEMMEADLDKEIAGMATPDISSSTLSGKEDSSSPEPEHSACPLKKEFDLDLSKLKTSTPVSPQTTAQKSGGEKLATPGKEVIATKLYELELREKRENMGSDLPEPMEVDTGDKDTGHDATSEPDVGQVSGGDGRLSASLELAKTAVEQYASLMKGAEEERVLKEERVLQDHRVKDIKKPTDIMFVSMDRRMMQLTDPEAVGLIDESMPPGIMMMSLTQGMLDAQAGNPSRDTTLPPLGTAGRKPFRHSVHGYPDNQSTDKYVKVSVDVEDVVTDNNLPFREDNTTDMCAVDVISTTHDAPQKPWQAAATNRMANATFDAGKDENHKMGGNVTYEVEGDNGTFNIPAQERDVTFEASPISCEALEVEDVTCDLSSKDMTSDLARRGSSSSVQNAAVEVLNSSKSSDVVGGTFNASNDHNVINSSQESNQMPVDERCQVSMAVKVATTPTKVTIPPVKVVNPVEHAAPPMEVTTSDDEVTSPQRRKLTDPDILVPVVALKGCYSQDSLDGDESHNNSTVNLDLSKPSQDLDLQGLRAKNPVITSAGQSQGQDLNKLDQRSKVDVQDVKLSKDSLEQDVDCSVVPHQKKTTDLDLIGKKGLTSSVRDVIVASTERECDPDVQLLADLEAGHIRGERPVSLVSSCSGDTGIVADYRSDTKDRPMSIVSTTSSADTGYQAEPDTDLLVSMTTSYPMSGSDMSARSYEQEVIVESDVTMETVAMQEGIDPGDGATDVPLQVSRGTKSAKHEDLVESDMDERSSPECAVNVSDGGEMSGTESQQEDELEATEEEVTIQEAITPEDEMDQDHMTLQHDHVTTQPANQQSDMDQIMEVDSTDPIGSPDHHDNQIINTEMIESATMRDVMEKCGSVEREQFVPEFKVEAHIEAREVSMEMREVPADVKDVTMEMREVPADVKDVTMEIVGPAEVMKPFLDVLGDELVAMDMPVDGRYQEHDASSLDINMEGIEPLEGEGHDEGEGHESQMTEEPRKVVSPTKSKSGKKPGKEVKVKSSVAKDVAKDITKGSTRSPRKRKDEGMSGSVPHTKSPRPLRVTESSPKPDTNKTSQTAKSSPNKTLAKTAKNQQDSDKKQLASKLLKNVSNKKKSEGTTSPGRNMADKKGKTLGKSPDKDKEQKLLRARKELDMLTSIPSETVSPHLTTVEARPVLDGTEDRKDGGATSKAPKRSLQPRKYGNVTSQIDSGRKPKAETKSGQSAAATSKVTQKSLLGLPRPSVTGKRTSLGAPRMVSNTGAGDAQSPKPSPKPSRPVPRLVKPTGGDVSDSQLSIGSDRSGKEGSRPPSGSRVGGRSSMSLKTGNRSPSIGSDSQLSDISQVSSQGVAPSRRTSAPAAVSKMLAPRRSMVPHGNKRTMPEPRRASLAVTASSRLTQPKAGAKGPTPLATSTPGPKRSANLNKSKAPRGGSATASTSSMKRPHQPDVVTNAISNANATVEIGRLEALCEARTKELKKLKIQLQQRSTGFEAMAVLIKYLTEELDAFSCPQLRSQLSEAQEHLKKAAGQLAELTNQRDALIAEIQSIKQQHATDTDAMVTNHQRELKALSAKLTKEREDEVTQVIDKHSKEVVTLKDFHLRNTRELQLEQERTLIDKQMQYEEELTRRKHEQEQHFAELHQDQEAKLNEITMRFETIKINLLDKVEYLRLEGEELRRREAAMTEKYQRESEYKIQHALGQYTQEVDSLRAVMDLRNAEIHELRRQNIEMEKELEKLPVSNDRVKSLEQKVENLQAIIDIRAGNERSLSEKHSVLLRKFDRESKAMKRLSMDNEELSWRLSMSQSECGSPDSMRRSISHSPTNSETSTPESTRRRKSPLPNVSPLPHSPRSPCDPKRSPMNKTPPKTTSSMKRTGTYDLLTQEYDDMNNIKQSDI